VGIVDYDNLYIIYRDCVDYCKKEKIKHHFKVDSGSWETAIEFTATGWHHPPKSKNWKEVKQKGNEIKCPDLVDFDNKIIFEYEETPKPGKHMGKLGKKGHTSESKKDTNRDTLYRIAGFKVLKIWESELNTNSYIPKLHKFLHEVYRMSKNNIHP